MFEREIIIAGLRREQNNLRELIEALEDKSYLLENDFQYCDEVLKNIETTLRRLRKPKYNYGKYAF